MIIKMMETGPLMVNCYIVGDDASKEAAVFDPGGNDKEILKVLNDLGLTLKYIINTHTHWDHVGGNKGLQEAHGASILTHWREAPDLKSATSMAGMFGSSAETSEASEFIKEGDVITKLGGVSLLSGDEEYDEALSAPGRRLVETEAEAEALRAEAALRESQRTFATLMRAATIPRRLPGAAANVTAAALHGAGQTRGGHAAGLLRFVVNQRLDT